MPARFEPDGLTVFRKIHHTEFYGDVSLLSTCCMGTDGRADRAVLKDAPRRFDRT